jgi:hypothetical protein
MTSAAALPIATEALALLPSGTAPGFTTVRGPVELASRATLAAPEALRLRQFTVDVLQKSR